MDNVFIRRTDTLQPGFTVGVMLGNKETRGDVGLEIEVEGNKFPKPEGYEGTHQPVKLAGTNYWSYVHDGSLRGKDNAEYVLTRPILFGEVPKAVDEIFDKLKKYGSVMTESNRTSVHVHMNCQQFHLNRLTSLLALYYTFEEVLTEWCGDHRVGNLFCMRAVDAPAIITQVKKFIKTDGRYQLSDSHHYAALNTNALFKLGSLECRTLRGVNEAGPIVTWVSILQRLYEMSSQFEDPREIIALFSQEGPVSFFDSILGEHAKTVRDGIEFDYDRIGESMYEGIRMAQDLCYSRDWSLYRAQKLAIDPFGRDAKKMAKKLTSSPVTSTGGMVQMSQEMFNQVYGLNTLGALGETATPPMAAYQILNGPPPPPPLEWGADPFEGPPEPEYDDVDEGEEI